MPTTVNIVNLDYLKLMTDGDEEMEQTMLEMLLSELPEEFEKMEALHAAHDWQDLNKVSHKMKSTLAFIGNEDLTNANLKIEQLTKVAERPPVGEDINVVNDMMQQFGALLPKVMKELKQLLDSY